MDRVALVVCILAFVTVVNGACQAGELTKCMNIMAGASTDPNVQCKQDLPKLTACINPHRETCKDDPTLAMVLPMETKMINLCKQFSGEGSDCALMSCSQMTPYVTGLPEGTIPQATPEFCEALTQFKMCFETQKAKGNCDANMLQSYTQMLNGYSLMCGGCNAQKMTDCAKEIESLASSEFAGYPTSQQIETVCPKMDSFKACISPVRAACAKVDNPQGKQVTQAINAAIQMVDLICGGDLKADFLKYGKECFDKPGFKNITNICKMLEVPSSENTTPKKETQTEMCSRIKKEFDCYSDNVGKACSDATVDFVKKVEISFYNIIAEPLSCPISGSTQLMSHMWLLIAVLIAGVFLF